MEHCPPEFKADAVALYESRPKATIEQIAADLGVNPETLRNWIGAAGAGRPRGRRAAKPPTVAVAPSALEAEVAALRRGTPSWRGNGRSCARRPAVSPRRRAGEPLPVR
ncbi:transposase [Streptomyces sp. NPDC001732]